MRLILRPDSDLFKSLMEMGNPLRGGGVRKSWDTSSEPRDSAGRWSNGIGLSGEEFTRDETPLIGTPHVPDRFTSDRIMHDQADWSAIEHELIKQHGEHSGQFPSASSHWITPSGKLTRTLLTSGGDRAEHANAIDGAAKGTGHPYIDDTIGSAFRHGFIRVAQQRGIFSFEHGPQISRAAAMKAVTTVTENRLRHVEEVVREPGDWSQRSNRVTAETFDEMLNLPSYRRALSGHGNVVQKGLLRFSLFKSLHPRLRLTRARAETHTSPTHAQTEAGNYRMGKLTLHGLPITIETPKGAYRKSKPGAVHPWKVKLRYDYGYINRTLAPTDGDHVDCLIGPNAESELVFVVDQVLGGKFDEHKCVLGCTNEAQARQVYLSNYSPGWKGLGAIHRLSIDQFKDWLKGFAIKKG